MRDKGLIDLTGQSFGSLTVAERAGRDKWGQATWLCECDCGEMSVVRSAALRTGNTKSCGCFLHKRLITHGLSKSPEYRAWVNLRARCTNPNEKDYHNYGARGIMVCERWLYDFQAFYDDMGPRPSPEHSIERRDNDAGYHPDNCRWATRKEQGKNRRTNRLLTHNGQTQCVAAWADELGIRGGPIYDRLYAGWSMARALETPVQG